MFHQEKSGNPALFSEDIFFAYVNRWSCLLAENNFGEILLFLKIGFLNKFWVALKMTPFTAPFVVYVEKAKQKFRNL
jgi:hypothetical protein